MSDFTKTGEHVSPPGSHITSDMVSKMGVILHVPHTYPVKKRHDKSIFLIATLIIIALIALIGIFYNMTLINSSLKEMIATIDEINMSLDAYNKRFTDMDTKLSLIDESLMSIEETLRSISAALPSDKKGFLGITVTNGEAKGDEAVIKGVIIFKVEKGSPAEASGLKKDDMIVQIDGTGVTDTEEFMSIMSDKKPGDVISLDIIRDGWMSDEPIKVKLSEKTGLYSANIPEHGMNIEE